MLNNELISLIYIHLVVAIVVTDVNHPNAKVPQGSTIIVANKEIQSILLEIFKWADLWLSCTQNTIASYYLKIFTA